MPKSAGKQLGTFHIVLIKPTHYDDDGYPLQWRVSAMPTNTLAVLNALILEAKGRQVLGSDVDFKIHLFDECNTHIPVERLVRMIQRDGGRCFIGFVGVQSNQFPRAVDLARRFRAHDLPVCIGGFHVSGCMAMLDEMPQDMVDAQEMGISFFAGEAENGRLDEVLRDAWDGKLQPVYDHIQDLPDLRNQPTPILPAAMLQKTAGTLSTIDLGRGCPFQCSFCTIINVQGRVSRHRTPDDVEAMIRANLAQGVNRFFITDDNFARNREWEALFDRIIEMREQEKLKLKLVIQVDTLCHKIPGFIEKAARAGVRRVFIGLENINADNLADMQKRQNKLTEYREMLQQWKFHGVITYAGYIVGMPNDTPESLLRDVEILKNELAIDVVEFNLLTPLPGSADHKRNLAAGVWMDPDMNKYDLNHWVLNHPNMSYEEMIKAYTAMWDSFYSMEHMKRVMRRSYATGTSPSQTLTQLLWYYLSLKIEGTHPIDAGYFRRKYRKERRDGQAIENPVTFYPRRVMEIIWSQLRYVPYLWELFRYREKLKRDPNARKWRDLSLTPEDESADTELAMYQETRGGAAEVARIREQAKRVQQARESSAATGS